MNINPVLRERAAAYIRDTNKVPAEVAAGLRLIKDQTILYTKWQKWSSWLKTKVGKAPPKANQAAKPGTSWHEFGLALDFNRIKEGVYPGTLTWEFKLWELGKPETILNRYGLTHSAPGEPWHIIPIECKGYTGDRSKFLD
jgi:hypothetical protein